MCCDGRDENARVRHDRLPLMPPNLYRLKFNVYTTPEGLSCVKNVTWQTVLFFILWTKLYLGPFLSPGFSDANSLLQTIYTRVGDGVFPRNSLVFGVYFLKLLRSYGTPRRSGYERSRGFVNGIPRKGREQMENSYNVAHRVNTYCNCHYRVLRRRSAPGPRIGFGPLPSDRRTDVGRIRCWGSWGKTLIPLELIAALRVPERRTQWAVRILIPSLAENMLLERALRNERVNILRAC